jgi:hypothetical protein
MKRMKLNIQLFSGGSYDYTYNYLDIYYHNVYDEELDLMIQDLREVLHDLEWWQSSDIGEEDYRKTLNDFKKKWFGNRDERLKEIIENKCKELEKYLLNVVGE